MAIKVKKSKEIESLFVNCLRSFVDENKEGIASIVMDSIKDDLENVCRMLVAQSMNWYKSEVKHYFDESLEVEIKKEMNAYVSDINNGVSEEVSELFKKGSKFKGVVKEMVKERISGSISECLKSEIDQEVILNLMSKK